MVHRTTFQLVFKSITSGTRNARAFGMLGKLAVFSMCFVMIGCNTFSNRGQSTLYQNGNFSYLIKDKGYTSRLGQGFLREYNSKCRLLTARHVYIETPGIEAKNRKNKSLDLDINSNADISAEYEAIDLVVFDVSKSMSNCPKATSSPVEPNVNDSMKMIVVLASGDLRAFPVTWAEFPGRRVSDSGYKVRVNSDDTNLQQGYSGGVLLSENGEALGMLQKIDNGIGIVQPMVTLDRAVMRTIETEQESPGLCARNRLLCVGGGAVVLVGSLLALGAAAGGDGSESAEERNVNVTAPLP